jgi:hypothetical protein
MMAQFTVIDKNGFQKTKTGLVSLADLSPNASANLSDGSNIALLSANNHFTGAGNQIFDGNVEPATMQMFSWNVKASVGTPYLAASDGLVIVNFGSTNLVSAANSIKGNTDTSNPPTTTRAYWVSSTVANTEYATLTFPVRKGDYYEIVGTPGVGGSIININIWWVPLGTAG